MPILEHRNVPYRSSLMTRQNSSSDTSVTVPSCGVEPPALLCKISSLPKRLIVSAKAASTLIRSRTSQCTKTASPPEFSARARAESAAALPLFESISAITTLAPSSANRSAVARPMPPPPPVMNATLPANRAMRLYSLPLNAPCMHNGTIGEDDGRAQRRAGTRIASRHHRRHIIATGIKSGNWLSVGIQHARIGVGRQTRAHRDIRRPNGDRVERRLHDGPYAGVWFMAGVAVEAIELRFAFAEIDVGPRFRKTIVARDRGA